MAGSTSPMNWQDQASKATAAARIAYQNPPLYAVLEPIWQAGEDAITSQEGSLRTVTGDAVGYATHRVGVQEEALVHLVNTLRADLRAAIVTGQAKLADVQGILEAIDDMDPDCGPLPGLAPVADDPRPGLAPVFNDNRQTIISGGGIGPVGPINGGNAGGYQQPGSGGIGTPGGPGGGPAGWRPGQGQPAGQGQPPPPAGQQAGPSSGPAGTGPEAYPGGGLTYGGGQGGALGGSGLPGLWVPPGGSQPVPGLLQGTGQGTAPIAGGNAQGAGASLLVGAGTGGSRLIDPWDDTISPDPARPRNELERADKGLDPDIVAAPGVVRPTHEVQNVPPDGVMEEPARFPAGACQWQPLAERWPALLAGQLEVWRALELHIVQAMEHSAKQAYSMQLITGLSAILGGSVSNIVGVVVFEQEAGLQVQKLLLQARHVMLCMRHLGERQHGVMMTLLVARGYVQAVAATAVDQSKHPLQKGAFAVDVSWALENIDGCIRYLCPSGVPTPPEAVNLFLAGQIDEARLVALAAWHGMPSDVVKALARASRSRMTADGELRDWLRYRTDPEDMRARLRSQGWTDDAEAERFVRQGQYMPGPQDLITFAVRDVYNRAKIGRAKMEEEYDEQEGLKEVLAAAGVGDLTIKPPGQPERTEDMGKAYWLAHYHNVSPTQIFEMLHRLRPGRNTRFNLAKPGEAPIHPRAITIDDVRALLKEDDYNPVFRDELAAIAYHRLGRIDIRRIYESGGFGEPRGRAGFAVLGEGQPAPSAPAEIELVATLEDAGHPRVDAVRLAWWMAGERDRKAAGKVRADVVKYTVDLYMLGSYSRDRAFAILRDAGLSLQDAEMALERGEMIATAKQVTQALKVARKLFLSGQYDRNAARQAMATFGIDSVRMDDHLRTWTLELAARSKEATAGQMCDWYAKGLITLPQMEARLLRIGYGPEDARRIVAHCRLGVLAKGTAEAAKVAKAQEAARAKAAKSVESMRTRREKEDDKRTAKILAGRSDKNLIAWWQAGLMRKSAVRATLLERGMAPNDVQRWMTTYLKPKKEA